jgi:hypothetical protein
VDAPFATITLPQPKKKTEKKMSAIMNRPLELTDAELDAVAGGQLLTLVLADLVDIGDVNVEVAAPINLAAAVAVLGNATALALQDVGGITQ